ncbi:hypothetical protein GOBAR_AA24455 [Gossypium barbadense]|uniref:Uncharacterized protein n=1 Tax=Gossypium barbadense TaxID=3634 RepID=A0A2P5WYQ3_GOSBA|nr:hypothetical protein GOBAR_AA24455 [Gossypium barbadense]
MKPSHELDERVVVAESIGPRVVGRCTQPRTTPVYSEGVSHSCVEEIESSIVLGTPVVFHSHACGLLSSSPTAMSHGRGDLSHPVFWGNHVPLQHNRIAWSCLFPCLAMALGTLVAELGMTHLHRTEWKNTEYQ